MGLTVHVGLLALAVAEGDDEAADQLRGELAIINDILRQAGLPAHDEPESAAEVTPQSWDMIGYAGLHYLRHAAAHLDLRGVLPPPSDDILDDDPVLDAYVCAALGDEPSTPEAARLLAGAAGATSFDHLILHSAASGYYVPVPMDHPIVLEADEGEDYEVAPDTEGFGAGEELLPGGNLIGSSVGLRDELRRLRDALGVPPDVGPDDDRLREAADAQGQGEGWARYGVEAFTCVQLLAACEASVAAGAALVFA
jgi:hypothetical protein